MLELGEKTEQYHAEIGRYINYLPYVKSVFLFGNLVRYIQKAMEGVDCDYDLNDITLWRPKPSEESPFGFSGRIAIMEQMVVTEPIQRYIRGDVKDINTDAIEATARGEGMLTLEQKGILAALRGESTIEEVSRVV